MKHSAFTILAASTLLATLVGCGQTPTGSSRPVMVDSTDKRQTTQSGNQADETLAILQPAIAEEVASVEAIAATSVIRPRVESRASVRSKMAVDSRLAFVPSANSMIADRVVPHPPVKDREHYLQFDDNAIKQVSVDPVSTFSIDVDTAAYSNMRRMIAREGRLPPRDAVRIEEMINYFTYQYPEPESIAEPFTVATELAPAPWNEQRHLLRIGLQGYQPPAEQRPAANLVFLVDVSGSMQAPDKLPVVKTSLRLLVNNMTEDDQIALVVYAGAAGVVLEPTSASDKSKILRAIDGLQAGGSTHGSAGIKLAYALAREHYIDDGINRVLIASDGDMNVGTVSIDALVELIERERNGGIQLSTLGFGSGNYNYSLMEQLADTGNGTASYIDSIKEAHKVLVSEIQSTLLTIAKDVKIQIEFNPEAVSEYRLIGYENRMLATEDFKNDKVDAGDIGAGHSVTAFYELSLRGSGASAIDPLRYQTDATVGNIETDSTDVGSSDSDRLEREDEIAHIKLRYKRANESRSVQIERTVEHDQLTDVFGRASGDFRFASAVAGFAQHLRGGKYNDTAELSDMLDILRHSRGRDEHGYRSEFISLVELALSLTGGGNAGTVSSASGG